MIVEPMKSHYTDLEAILTLQKTAYQEEAKIYNDFSIPPLHQTLDEIKKEFSRQSFLKVVQQDRIIASIRAHEANGTCFIGKLVVDPSFQNRGIGTRLLHEIENVFSTANRFELFTGHKSAKNLYLYGKHGYSTFKRKQLSSRLTLVYLEKYVDRMAKTN